MGLFVRITATLAVSALAGCAATREQVPQNLGDAYVGRDVDSLVGEFGPPASTIRMNSGEVAYVWQLSATTNVTIDRSSGTVKTPYCKVNVISSPTGIVTKLTTEDVAAGGGGLFGAGGSGSICARRLRG